MPVVKDSFPFRLKSARQARKFSGRYLGQQLGVAQQTVHSWEAGLAEPNIDTLHRIAAELGVSVAWLLGEEPIFGS